MLKPVINMKIKLKTCKECKAKFTPFKPLQSVCSPLCAINKVNKNKLKIQKEAYKIEKERIKTRSDWIKEVQTACNAYIRARDADKPCISCGCGNTRYVGGKPKQTAWDAGHYKTAGAHPELRFNEENIHKQCVHDNQHKHGDAINYRLGLIQRIGLDRVEWLEGKHPPAKWTIEELKALKTEFKLKLKAINGNN
jgi:hypothetical protein